MKMSREVLEARSRIANGLRWHPDRPELVAADRILLARLRVDRELAALVTAQAQAPERTA